MPLPVVPGTYALVLAADLDSKIQVGRLGRLDVRPGFYVYVGSAHGPGGLAGRVFRHVRRGKTLHWHVDHLREVTDLTEVWYTADEHRRECRWATVLLGMNGIVPQEGFGASDCSCRSHLFFFQALPSSRAFRRRLRQPGCDRGRVWRLAGDRLHDDQARC